MSAEGKSSWYISMANCMPLIPSDLSSMHRNLKMWWENGRADNDALKCRSTEVKPSGYIRMPKCRVFLPSRFVRNTKAQVHGQLDGRTNAWNENNTHRHRPRVRHMDASACQLLCLPSMWYVSKCAKTWKCDERTGGWTDGRTEGQREAEEYYYANLTWYRTKVVINENLKTLQWRQNGRGGVSTHQPHHHLLNRLFR